MRARLDLFGTLVLAVPPGWAAGWFATSCSATYPRPGWSSGATCSPPRWPGVATFLWHPVVARWENIILTLDAAGLALFCVIGALKASDAGLDIVPAALLGMITAIGGGIARDVLANRVPVVLRGRLVRDPRPASAPPGPPSPRTRAGRPRGVLLPGIAVCFTWRALALHRDWSPRPARGIG